MAADDKTARFNLELGGNVPATATDLAKRLEALRQKIQGTTNNVKAMQGALRNLKGSSAEVGAAKELLKAKIGAAQGAISAATTELVSNGAALSSVKGKTDDAAKGFAGFIAQLGGAEAAAALAAGALLGLVTGIISLTAAFARFVITSADSTRSMALLREGASGSAENAARLGTQIDALAGKVPLAEERIQELGVSLLKTRLSGQAIVDSMNAVAQASAAMGDQVGKTFEDILTRGQLYNSFQLNPIELQGTGVQFGDVAAQLAGNLNIGVEAAKKALFEGRIKLDDGAKALRGALEKRFGDINLRQMLTLDNLTLKFKETLSSLTSGVNIEPLLRGFGELSKLFSSSTVTGAAIKDLVTLVGSGLVSGFTAALPLAKKFLQGLVIGALTVAIAFKELKHKLEDTFIGKWLKDLDGASTATTLGKAAVYGLVGAVGLLVVGLAAGAAAFATIAAPIIITIGAVYGLYKAFTTAYDYIVGISWGDLGASLVDGIVNGITAGLSKIKGAVTGLATSAKDAFKNALGIASPSKVFGDYGRMTAQGAEEGIEAGAGGVQSAADSLAPSAPQGGGQASGRGAASVTVNVTINAGHNSAKDVTSPNFLRDLTKAVEEACRSAGIPIQASPSNG